MVASDLRYFRVFAPVVEIFMLLLVAQFVLLAVTVSVGDVLPVAGVDAVPKSRQTFL